MDSRLGDHHEDGGVDGIDALAQDPPLPAALAAGFEEADGVLEAVAVDDAAERFGGRQRLAVAGIDVADAAFRNGNQRHLVDGVLPKRIAHEEATAQDFRLEAGLAVEGDDPAIGQRAAGRPEFLDDPDPAVRDIPHAEEEIDGRSQRDD